MMKVLIITESYPPKIFGGGEISARNLAESLAQKKINTTVLTSYFSGLQRTEKKDNLRILRLLKTGSSPRKLSENIKREAFFPRSVKKELNELLKKENFDIIHCLNNTSTLAVPEYEGISLAATINSYVNLCPKANLFYKEEKACTGCSPLKFVVCMMNSEYIGKQKLNFYLKYNPLLLIYIYARYIQRKNSLKKFNLLCRSTFISEFVIKNNISEKKIGLEYNLFDPNINISKFSRLKKRLNNQIVITYIGSLEKIKGVDVLIRLYSKVDKKSNSKLLIVGDGSKKDSLIRLAENLGIKHRVIFTGRIEYEFIPYMFDQTDILAFFSKWPEPFSRVLMEGLYFGKPIIATNKGGNSDAVIDNKNGFLIDSEKTIPEKLKVLIHNKKLRIKFGKESKKLYENKFKKEKVIQDVIDFYKEITS
ncbi:glycosyltransferase [Candidatus Woesearchaeota archaeon]|nr:glycosyltransferase [Candidatus Woesearchaeota archaeon]